MAIGEEWLAILSVGRTTLVLAHRLATIRDADCIVVVDETGIAEQGAHADLLAKGGIYRGLHGAQDDSGHALQIRAAQSADGWPR